MPKSCNPNTPSSKMLPGRGNISSMGKIRYKLAIATKKKQDKAKNTAKKFKAKNKIGGKRKTHKKKRSHLTRQKKKSKNRKKRRKSKRRK